MIFLGLPYFFLDARPDVTIIGFFNSEYGLGNIPNNILEALKDDISANLINTFPQNLSFKKNQSPYFLKALNNPDQSTGRVMLMTDVVWSITDRNIRDLPIDSEVKLAYSMFETTKIPQKWVDILNGEFDGIVVPDPYLIKVYKNSGVKIPIFVLPIPMNLEPYFSHPLKSKPGGKPFIFGDCSANKNPCVLLEAFSKAFGNNSDFHLILRSVGIWDRSTIDDLISKLQLSNVTVDDNCLSREEYIELISNFDCYINLSRGEGFSLIPREALALGIPVIITKNTALKTICNSGYVRSVKSQKLVPPLLIYKLAYEDDCGYQFDCEVDDVVEALLDVYDNYDQYFIKAQNGREWVQQYDCNNKELSQLYKTLFKPKKVKVGKIDKIENGKITTTSKSLFRKYKKIMNSR